MRFSLSTLLTQLFFPPTCLRCGTEGIWLCASCGQTIPDRLYCWCPDCAALVDAQHVRRNHTLPVANVYSLLPYQESWVSAAIWAAKYQGAYRIMRRFGQLLADRADALRLDPATMVVSFVPLHVRRRRERGFDQAEELAAAFARCTGLPIAQVVERNKATTSQATLPAAERRQNMTDAFRQLRIDQNTDCVVSKKNVILLDDVVTTGSTVTAVAALLQRLGAHSVTVLTVAYSDPS